jgi:DNA polymerase-1
MDQVTKDQRRAAKVINFGILYGMSVKGLSDAAKMPIYEAKQFIDNYFKLRAPIKQKLDSILKQAREEGFVETFYGRRRPTPDVKSSNFVIRQAAERAAQNMPIQGTEADLMKRAMIKVDAKLPENAELVMQVHDSLIVECDEKNATDVAHILKTEMESVAPELKIKLAVEVTIGHNWGEL